MTTLSIWAAGSLRKALTDIASRFERKTGIEARTEFGPSGILRHRIEEGAKPDLFASADTSHPVALFKAGLSNRPILFAHNRMCLFGPAGTDLESEDPLDYMMRPGIRLGTSTPGDDPSGDFAWEVFRKADKILPGAYEILNAKAKKLVGGPNNSAPVKGQSPVVELFVKDLIDVFLGYRTSAEAIELPPPGLAVAELNGDLAVKTDLGLAVMADAQPETSRLVSYITGPEGQHILENTGFEPAVIP